jgi:hypothetical protein
VKQVESEPDLKWQWPAKSGPVTSTLENRFPSIFLC